jgi:hypothetical protein
MTDKIRLRLGELESLAHHEYGHKSKEYLLDYIGWMWCLLQDLSPDFKADLISDYETYIEETKENARLERYLQLDES